MAGYTHNDLRESLGLAPVNEEGKTRAQIYEEIRNLGVKVKPIEELLRESSSTEAEAKEKIREYRQRKLAEKEYGR